MPESLLRVIPKIRPRLDPDFRPAALGNRNFVQAAHASGRAAPLLLALEHAGVVTRYDTACFPAGHANEGQNFYYAERILKFLLWQRGGSRLRLCGPPGLAKSIRQCYAPGASRSFDAGFFSGIYGSKSFQVAASTKAAMPRAKGGARPMGRHLEGCRIGFDAGASSRKVAALIDGKEVFSVGTAWEPKLHSNWRYHFDGINDSIARAARHLPRIDAIGVSSAGICVGKQIKVSSLFRKVQAEHPRDFKAHIQGIYPAVAKKWGNPALELANDGDVAALAGAMSLGQNSVLGLSLGSSLAAGYVDSQGSITGWLNELAFAPLDYSGSAPRDKDWSGDQGIGADYLSQDAVIRLAKGLGISFKADDGPGARLKRVQGLLRSGDPRPVAIFETVGVYLGYALLQYAAFYDFKQALIMGGVSSGKGGEIILAKAREVLDAENPGHGLQLHLPEEAKRRVGQAVAAASLPEIKKRKSRRS